jgi:hypothetical protein
MIYSEHSALLRGNFMELKMLALSALCGASLTVVPAMAQSHGAVHGHLTVTPIFCDEEGCFNESGAFSRYATSHSGHFINFGMADSECEFTFVGARIDAPGFPADNWSIVLNAPNSDPFFITELISRNGQTTFVEASSFIDSNGNVHASFNGPDPGERFVSIFIYDNGGGPGISFQDSLNLDHGVRVDGSFPVAVTRHLGVSDCSNFNATSL